jgi:hypothetical protein
MKEFPMMMLGLLLLASAGCSTKPAVQVVPSDRLLEPVVICPKEVVCATDPGRWSISKGYLRDIERTLVDCQR